MQKLIYRYRKSRSGLTPLYLSALFRAIATNSLTLFTAVHLYKLGQDYSGYQATGINWVIYFGVSLTIFKLSSMFIAEEFSRRKGYKTTIRFSYIPFAVAFIFMIFFSNNFLSLILASIFWGIHAGFFWWGYHGIFIKKGKLKHFGSEIGKITLIFTIISIAGPITFGYILANFGYSAMSLFAIAFLILSFLVIGEDYDETPVNNMTPSGIFNLISSHKVMTLGYIGEAIQADLIGRFWPLYLLIILGGPLELGVFASIISLASAFFAVIVGRITDQVGGRKLVYIGTPISFATWIIRIIASTPILLIIADSIHTFSSSMIGIPLMDSSYIKGKQKGSANAIMFREVAINIGIMFSMLLLFIANNLGFYYFAFFALGIINSLLILPAAKTGKFDFTNEKN